MYRRHLPSLEKGRRRCFDWTPLAPPTSSQQHLLARLGVSPAEALMVGNSLARDIAGGKRAGVATCWLALEGEEEPVGLVEPDHTISSLGELPAIVGV